MSHPFKKAFLLGLFFLVLISKVAETEFLAHLEYCHSPYAAGGHWANTTGDSFSYIGAMENYITTGAYYFINEKGDAVKAGRLPHYAVPYFIFRQFSSPRTAIDLFVLFQLAVESAAIICLALLAFYLTKRKWCFYSMLVLSVISLYVTVWSYNTFTDAISTNLLVIAAFFYYRYLQTKSNRAFLFFSIALGVVTCFRPYFALVYLFVGIAELVNNGFALRYLLKKFLLLSLPLILLLAPWVVRNLVVMNKFILFQQDMYAGYGFTQDELAVRKALTSFGEDGGSWWNRKSAASYFSHRSETVSEYSYPSYIKQDSAFLNKLETFRQLCLDSNRDAQQVTAASENIVKNYRSEYPVRYYFTNHLVLVAKFVVNNGSYHLPVNKQSACYQPPQYALKLFQSLLYFLSLVFGTAGLVLMTVKKRQNLIFLFTSLYLIILFPVLFGLTEWRYFLPFYYFHLLGLVYLAWWFKEERKNNFKSTDHPV